MKPLIDQPLGATTFRVLLACDEAKPVQEIADDVKISYAEVMEHLSAIGENVQLRYVNFPNGVLAVEIFRVPSSHNIVTVRNERISPNSPPRR
jgi:hypothetical protein